MSRKSKWVEVRSPNESVEDVARRVLEDRLDLVWHYLPRAAKGPKSETENVHQLRVATRRAVAALDTFSHLLGKRRLKWMNKQLKKVRRAAGDARDFDVLYDRLSRLSREKGSAATILLMDEVKA